MFAVSALAEIGTLLGQQLLQLGDFDVARPALGLDGYRGGGPGDLII